MTYCCSVSSGARREGARRGPRAQPPPTARPRLRAPVCIVRTVRSALASLSCRHDDSRHYRLPADGSPSLLYVFSPEHMLGARAYSAVGQEFQPGTRQGHVRLEFWADDPWTDVVDAGAHFTICYGGDVGDGVIEAVL